MKTLDELRHLRENLAKQDNRNPWHHQVWKTLLALLDEAIEEREERLMSHDGVKGVTAAALGGPLLGAFMRECASLAQHAKDAKAVDAALEATTVKSVQHAVTDDDLFYLRSILNNLKDLRHHVCTDSKVSALGLEVLADNIDWLDCFIGKLKKEPIVDAALDVWFKGEPWREHRDANTRRNLMRKAINAAIEAAPKEQ